MSAFHRADDARNSLPGPLYFARAQRLGAYAGVMQSRILEQQQREKDGGTSPASGVNKTRVSDETLLAQLANDGWIERG